MSTTRTNDNALTKKQQKALRKQLKKLEDEQQIAKAQLATLMTKAFLASPLSNRTELMYCFVGNTGSDYPIVKIGRTTLLIALFNRSGMGCTYKKGYSYQNKRKCKEGDPLPDEELKLLIEDLQAKLKKGNGEFLVDDDKIITCVEDGIAHFVCCKRDEAWPYLYLATGRFGSQEYIKYPVLYGWYAFPHEVVDGVLHNASYWEGKVQEVLKPFRIEHNLKETEEVIPDFDDPRPLRRSAERRMVLLQNTSDDTENATFTSDDFWEYLEMYRTRCLELGGIWIRFTDSFYRQQIQNNLNTKPYYTHDFVNEITKCHWEGIKRRMVKDGIDV